MLKHGSGPTGISHEQVQGVRVDCVSELHRSTRPPVLWHRHLSYGCVTDSLDPMMLLYYRPLSRPRRWQSSQRAELQVIHESSSLCKKTSSQRLEFTLARGQWPSWLVRGLPGDYLEAWGERGLGRGIWMTYGRRHER